MKNNAKAMHHTSRKKAKRKNQRHAPYVQGKRLKEKKHPNATRPGKTAKESKTTVLQREKEGNPFKFHVSLFF
jgi:hypothetical protein